MALTLVEAARLMWCPGLAQLNGHPTGTIHDWLASATFAPVVVGNSITLTGINKQHFLQALGSDINRMTSVGSETLKNIIEINGLPKSLAWPYVKLYYASVFYTHAMLRIWGRSPSYFRTLELIPLRGTLKAYAVNPPYKVQTGQYLLVADTSASSISLLSDNGSGGSHEFVWREFQRALADLRVAVSNGPYLTSDKQDIDRQLKALIGLLTHNGSNLSWPSQMRNDIQYRQAEGVWYPYKGKEKTAAIQQDVAALITGQAEMSKLISASGNNLAQFRFACSAIICFVRGVISDLGAVSGGKSFLRYGQRRFEDSVIVTP